MTMTKYEYDGDDEYDDDNQWAYSFIKLDLSDALFVSDNNDCVNQSVKLNSWHSIYFSSLQPPQLQLSHLSIAGKSDSEQRSHPTQLRLKLRSHPTEVRLRSHWSQTQNHQNHPIQLKSNSDSEPNSRQTQTQNHLTQLKAHFCAIFLCHLHNWAIN